MSIFQMTYAVQRPVTKRVARKRIKRFRRLDSVRIGRVEAYALGRPGRPLESLDAVRADREHGARPLRAAVDARPRDAGQGLRPGQAASLAVAGQEADAGPAGPVPGPEPLRRNLLAERGREREPVEVDPERRLAELRLVAAADPGRELQHERPVRAEPDLRDARSLHDPERLDRAGRESRRLLGVVALPDVRERRSVGHYQRLELTFAREGAHRHDRLLRQLLDEGEADPRSP